MTLPQGAWDPWVERACAQKGAPEGGMCLISVLGYRRREGVGNPVTRGLLEGGAQERP